jgi:hypothetical protein
MTIIQNAPHNELFQSFLTLLLDAIGSDIGAELRGVSHLRLPLQRHSCMPRLLGFSVLLSFT